MGIANRTQCQEESPKTSRAQDAKKGGSVKTSLQELAWEHLSELSRSELFLDLVEQTEECIDDKDLKDAMEFFHMADKVGKSGPERMIVHDLANKVQHLVFEEATAADEVKGHE